MRNLFFVLLFLLIYEVPSAQTAPDFTVTTTEGVTRSLYDDYLNQGKIVVLEFFFTTCPPCNQLAPSIQAMNESLGNGNDDVVFLELSIMPFDQNDDIIAYEALHDLTYFGVGTDGGSTAAIAPYINGDFGNFGGTPEFAVINPLGTVHFPIAGFTYQQTLQNLNDIIQFELSQLSAPAANIAFETVTQNPINLVDIYMNGSTVATNINGNYTLAIPDITGTLIPRKPDNPKNGVSTFDMLLITKHILGIEPFGSPCKLAAADVNLSGSVTAADLLQIRKLILNIDSSFVSGQSWAFFLKDNVQYFGCDQLPFAPSQLTLENEGNYVFEGVKYGDVNNNANPANLVNTENRNRQFFELLCAKRETSMEVAVDFRVKDLDILEGFQMAFQFDPSGMIFTGFQSPYLADFNADNFGLTRVDQGELYLNWLNPFGTTIDKNEVLFTLFFNKTTPSAPILPALRDDLLKAEVYLPHAILPLQIKYSEQMLGTGKVNILQVPVQEMLKLEISGIQNLPLKCFVYNNQGVVVKQADFVSDDAEIQMVSLPVDNLPSGIYYLQLESGLSGKLYSKFIKL